MGCVYKPSLSPGKQRLILIYIKTQEHEKQSPGLTCNPTAL